MRYLEVEYYVSKQNRDARAADIKARGFSCKKSSARSVVLAPTSVEDYTGPVSPNGFGGASAQWFSCLYKVEY